MRPSGAACRRPGDRCRLRDRVPRRLRRAGSRRRSGARLRHPLRRRRPDRRGRRRRRRAARDPHVRRPQAGTAVRAGSESGRDGDRRRHRPRRVGGPRPPRRGQRRRGVAAGPPPRRPQVAGGGVGRRRLAGHDRRAGAGGDGGGPGRRRLRPAVVARACTAPIPGAPIEVVGVDVDAARVGRRRPGRVRPVPGLVVGPGLGERAPPRCAGSSPRRSCRSSSTATGCGRSAPTASGRPPDHDAHPPRRRVRATVRPSSRRRPHRRGPPTGRHHQHRRPAQGRRRRSSPHRTAHVLLVAAGDARLATAGTGDVLSGLIAALVAHGVGPFHAAAAGAHLHGRAAMLGPADGLVASDVAANLPAAIGQVCS